MSSDPKGRRRALLAVAGITVLIWLAWRSRTDLLHVLASVSPTWIALGVLGGVALNIVYGLQFDALLAKHGGGHDRRRRVAAYLLSQPGKYVPGNLWQVLMQSFALGRDSRLATITIANIELLAIAIVQTTGLGLACLLRDSSLLAATALVGASLATLALARLPSVRLLVRIAPWMQRWLTLPAKLEPNITESTKLLLTLAVLALACNFAASWALLTAIHETIGPTQLMPLLASLYLGAATSLLAVPVPAGLGVREAAITVLGSAIAPTVAPTLIISIALVARCWQLLVDVISFALGWMLLRIPARAIDR